MIISGKRFKMSLASERWHNNDAVAKEDDQQHALLLYS